MEMLMLLAGQLAYDNHGTSGDDRIDRRRSGPADAAESGVRETARFALRLLASFAALGLVFALLDAAAPTESAVAHAQASLTPFSDAMWSDSIGR